MARFFIAAILIFTAAGLVAAQTATTPAPPPPPQTAPATTTQPAQPAPPAGKVAVGQALSWMVGTWQGQAPNTATQLTVTSEMNGQGLLIKRTAAGGYSDMMISNSSKSGAIVGMWMDNVSDNGAFKGAITGNQIQFTSITVPAGYLDNRTYALVDPNTLTLTLQEGKPGGQPATVVITYKK